MKLKALIDSEFQNIKKEVAFIAKSIEGKGKNPFDDILLRASALSMTAIYNGNERIITEATQKELVGFLSFRHFIRHAYSFEINPSTVEPILNKVQAIIEIIQKEIESILAEILKNE